MNRGSGIEDVHDVCAIRDVCHVVCGDGESGGMCQCQSWIRMGWTEDLGLRLCMMPVPEEEEMHWVTWWHVPMLDEDRVERGSRTLAVTLPCSHVFLSVYSHEVINTANMICIVGTVDAKTPMAHSHNLAKEKPRE